MVTGINQQELLGYIRGINQNTWFTSKQIHSMILKDMDVSYVCITKKLKCLYNWGYLEKSIDKNENHGFRYKLIEVKL
jgi:hypothetical protein